MMPTDADVALLRRFYAALAAVDLATVEKCLREDAIRLDVSVCQLMRVQDGMIVEVRGHYSDPTQLEAFFGRREEGKR